MGYLGRFNNPYSLPVPTSTLKYLLLLLLLCPAWAQAQLRDDFTDGNFTTNPAWTGDVGSFQVTGGQLQSNGPAVTGTQLQLVTPCQASTGTVWEFWANLRLATSSGNLADVWLMASRTDLRDPHCAGYYVRLGGTADEISLFRKDSARSATVLIDGQDAVLASTTNNLVRVRVTRSTANQWSLEYDAAGGRNFVAEPASPIDATHQRSVAFGVALVYSSANGRNFYFDDISVTDATAPQLLRAVPLSARQVDVVFNEAVAPASAGNPARYQLQGGGAPIAAQVLSNNPAVARLTFPSDFAAQNVLEVRNVADLFGNVASGPLQASFGGPTQPPLVGELVISEIFADETPQVGLPLSEYLEIHNRSATKVLSLRGVRLGKTGTMTVAVFPDTAKLRPGEYAIVCGSTRVTQFASFNAKVYGLTNFPTLSNGGDQLVLRGRDGSTLFEVQYSDTWYRDATKRNGGWSLEMIDTNNFCAGASNWIASNDPSGGTPGRVNSVRASNADTAAPTLLRAEQLDPVTIRLYFSEKLDSAAVSTVGRYSLPASAPSVVAAAPVGPDFRRVDLTLSGPLASNVPTTITVQMATDCAGNASGPLQTINYVEPTVAPLVGELVISEIFADETPVVGLPESEYLEIHNRTANKVLSLQGVRLGKVGTASFAVFPDTARLRPGQYAIVCGSTRPAQFAGFNAKVYGLTNFPSLTNEGGQLVLRDQNGRTLFEVQYSDAWYRDSRKQDGGWSLEMIDVNNVCAGSSNWAASTDPSGGTPGRTNSVRAANPDTAPPTLLRAVALNATTVRLYFSEKLDSAAAATTSRYVLAAPGPAVSNAAPVAPDFRQVDLTLATPLSASQGATLTVQTATDCAGNASGALQSATFALPEQAVAGDVVINEVLFNPRTGGVRFVELLNRSTKYVNLQGHQFLRGRVNGRATATPISPEPLILAPGQLMAFTPDIENIQLNYPTSHDVANLFEVSALPAFASNADTVFLLNGSGVELDRFAYTDDLHLALLTTQEGVSLERIRPNGPSLGSNFHSAAGTAGYATPGRPNSQAQDAPGGGQELSVEPEVFTPDDDGQQDFTTLNFQLDQPGYAASVTVYDALGRFTRHLLRNETVPVSGFVQWDGLDERGRKAAVGYYILHVELFRPSGGEKREYKKTVVVGARF